MIRSKTAGTSSFSHARSGFFSSTLQRGATRPAKRCGHQACKLGRHRRAQGCRFITALNDGPVRIISTNGRILVPLQDKPRFEAVSAAEETTVRCVASCSFGQVAIPWLHRAPRGEAGQAESVQRKRDAPKISRTKNPFLTFINRHARAKPREHFGGSVG